MNIALVLQHKFILGLQRLMGDAVVFASSPSAQTPRTVGLQRPATAHRMPAKQDAASSSALHGSACVGRSPRAPMPLRALRVLEKDQPRSGTGRMVISGRMADVCAELDRLAAREASLH